MKLSDIERRIIEHALGNPEKPYRDHYAAAADTEEYRACEALVGRGLMTAGQPLSYGRFFHVSETGRLALSRAGD